MDEQQLGDRLRGLDDAQLRQIFARVLMELDPAAGAIDSQEALDRQLNQDRLLLGDLAAELQLPDRPSEAATKGDASVRLLLLIAQRFPQHRPTLLDALDEAMEPDTHLDFGLSVAIGALVIATAAAIARPHVVI